MSLIEQLKTQGVAESGSTTVVQLEAPYIPSAIPLLNHGYKVEHTIFYRISDPFFSKPPKDMFALGRFTEHSYAWDKISGCLPNGFFSAELAQLFQEPFSLAGYMSYELGYNFEKQWQHLSVPDDGYAYRFLEVDCWYETDHSTKTGTIYTRSGCSKENMRLLNRVIDEQGPLSNDFSSMQGAAGNLPFEQIAELGELTRGQYKTQVQQILSDIYAGRFYELNFTQRFCAASAKSPLKPFQHLCTNYQPQRAFYGDFGSEVVASCSPELFLKKEERSIYTRPIKGSFKAENSSNEKAKLHAEHIMVVDLARNDIGRISDLEWVNIPELLIASSFGGLNHLESLIAGKTSMQVDQILPYTYPAASITGAPKVEVVKAIAQYEKSCRGVYTGACGWKWGSGDFDLNVAIRTFVARKQADEWKYTVGAGGAIVADSDPDTEYDECLQKALPLLSELLSCE